MSRRPLGPGFTLYAATPTRRPLIGRGVGAFVMLTALLVAVVLGLS
jgi:hypothetical protein